MKITRKQLRQIINEATSCPVATQSKDVNSENKRKASSNEKIMYGHPDSVSVLAPLQEVGKLCGNCVAFDITKKMQDCGGANAQGTVGYCKMHDFSCAAEKTCLNWAPGGPNKDKAV